MKNIILLGLIALLACSCQKDETTQPVPVNLQMEMVNEQVGINGRQTASSIHIESGRYLIAEMEFKGYRESGKDYFFEKEFEEGLEASMAAGQALSFLNFDMPQGVYERIAISLKVKKSGDDALEDTPFNEQASIILKGYYTNVRNQQIPLLFVYDYDDTFEFTAKQAGPQEVVAVGQGKSPEALIRFNPSYWLQLVNGRMLEGARLSEVNGVPTIILSEDHNQNIFDVLSRRIKDSSDLSFE